MATCDAGRKTRPDPPAAGSSRALVMFDLDGTLVDTSSLYVEGVPLAVERVTGQRIDVAAYVDLWGHDVRAWFARATGDTDEGAQARMYAEFEAFYAAHHAACPDYPGVGEGLARLKDQQCRVGIVTTRPQWRAELVRQFGWASSVDFIIGGDRVARRKPFPDSLDLAVDLHGQAGTPAVYVGDNASDIQAAKASRHGILGVGALWDCRDAARMREAQPDQVFETMQACVDWIVTVLVAPGAARS